MGKTISCFLAVILCAGTLRGQEPVKASPVQEIWEAAFLDGGRTGYFRTSFETIEKEKQIVIRSRQQLNLTVKRLQHVVQLKMQTGTDETADGKVVGTFTQMQQSDLGQLLITGEVKDNVLRYRIDRGDKMPVLREIPWNDRVIGLQAQERFFQGKKFKPGDKFTYQSFEPSFNTIVTIRAMVADEEEIVLLKEKKKLFKAALTADKIATQNGPVQLPPLSIWMDKDGNILRREVELGTLGKIVLVRTVKEIALAKFDPAQFTDIGLKNLMPVARRIPRHNATSAAVYRLTIDDEKPETVLIQDARQKIKKLEGKTIEVSVHAIRNPPKDGNGKIGEEFLKSCHYIDSDDQKVQELARKAVGTEDDPWFKARRIEGWVNQHLRIGAPAVFGPASNVAKELKGDCRQCAVLTAAMCRAVDVPSRTAIGFVYAEDRTGKTFFGTHMWTEVYVRGQWVGIDATLGEGSVGAAHIKVTDHSWHNMQSVTPLLPLQRAVGKIKIEVVRFSYGPGESE